MKSLFVSSSGISFISFIAATCSVAIVGSATALRFLGGDDVSSLGRRGLERHEAQNECGQEVASLSKDEIVSLLLEGVDDLDPLAAGFVTSFFIPSINYGVRAVKVCGSCQDFQSESSDDTSGGTTENSFDYYCGLDAYGSNATVSGMALLPVTSASDGGLRIAPGPRKGAIWMHGTHTETFNNVPSEFAWQESYDQFVAAVTLSYPTIYSGAVTISPDYLGYGESHSFYKSYLVKRAYQTSTMPLWLKAKELLRNETNCTSELADVVTVNGHSEGGYSAIAVAVALADMGVEVLGTFAGAGPYRLSTSNLVEGARLFDAGLYPSEGQHYLALWGSAYSTTNTNLPNFGFGQNMIADEYRSDVVSWVEEGLPRWEINDLIPDDDPLKLVNPELLSIVRMAVENNISDPCVEYKAFIAGTIDKLCEAFIANDLTDYLESKARHPINLCHSAQDDKVVYGNVRDLNLDSNPFLTHSEVQGDHSESFLSCYFLYATYLQSDEYRDAPVVSSDSCGGATGSQEESPTAAPSEEDVKLPSTNESDAKLAQPEVGEIATNGGRRRRCTSALLFLACGAALFFLSDLF